METEFIYWRHPTPPGIKIEEVCGGEDKPFPLWLDMAYQVYCENGKDGFREIGHYRDGSPFLVGETSRISISHAGRFLVVATLPPTPEVDLSHFSERAAMGVDAERLDREQVLKIRERFLSPEELAMIPADDVAGNVIAWTVKEALFKAMKEEGVDFREMIRIITLPTLGPATPVYKESDFPNMSTGEAVVIIDGETHRFMLYSYESEGNVVTLAYSAKCAKFGKNDR